MTLQQIVRIGSAREAERRARPETWATNEAYLSGEGRQDGLRVDEPRVPQVVEALLGEDLGTGLEPHSFAELDTSILLQDFRCQDPERAQESPPGVDDLAGKERTVRVKSHPRTCSKLVMMILYYMAEVWIIRRRRYPDGANSEDCR